jgi:hypothetical protein
MVVRAIVDRISVKEKSAVAAVDDARGLMMIHEEKVFVQLERPESSCDTKLWILDMGMMNHMMGSHAVFVILNTRVWGMVQFGDDSMVEIEGRGKDEFICKNGEHRTFEEVYFIPKLMANIISIGRLDKDGYQISIGDDELAIQEPRGRLLTKVKRPESMLYLLTVELSAVACLVSCREAEVWRWHERLGHLNFPAMKKLVHEDLIRDPPVIGSVEQPCEACQARKQRKTSFPA